MPRIDRPRILLVSIGMYGQKYLAEATEKDVGGDVVGIVDVAKGLEDKFPVIKEKSIPVYSSLDAFFTERQADLAVISSPIHLHAQMVIACLTHGLHVLCEKPLCLTEKETEEMAKASKKAGRFLALGWQLNYDRAVLALKKDILSGRFGVPEAFKCLHAMRRGKNYYARSNWAGKITADGREVLDSPFMNACAHNFQLITFLLGGEMDQAALPLAVQGQLFRGNPQVENYDAAALRFEMQGNVEVCYYTAHPLRTKNLGQMGVGKFQHATLTWGKGQPFRVVTDAGEEILYGMDGETPFMQKLYDAVACVKNGGAPLCGPYVGLGHLRAVRLAQELPVENIAPEHVEWLEEGNDLFPCVKDLESVFSACYEKGALPRELGLGL